MTPSFDTNMLPKVVFDKKHCLSNLKLVMTQNKTLMNQIQNNQKSIGKSIPGNLKISRKKFANSKSRDFCQIFGISNKKSIGQGMDLKIYIKSIG
jgi:hypothetical protein